MTSTMPAVELGALVTQLGGGLALFLYGMRRMTESLKTVAGAGMKNLLAQLTTNRFSAALAGIVVTAMIQSSSVTTVLVVDFISAGLLKLSQSIGVILGANVGTTMTAQIVAFAVYKYGLLMIAAGFFTEILARRERIKQWSTVLLGLGLIFFGMELMSIATGPLRQWPPFIELMQNMRNPLLAVSMGAVFTAIVQSSSATTGIVIVLASQGLQRLAADTPRQIANAHTIFNIANLLLFIWFTRPLSRLVEYLVPQKPLPEVIQPLYLDDYFLEQPALALDQVRRELVRLGGLVGEMMKRSMHVITTGTQREAQAIVEADDNVDMLYGETIRFLGRLSQKDLVQPQPRQLARFIAIANYLENIGDVIEKDLLTVWRKRVADSIGRCNT